MSELVINCVVSGTDTDGSIAVFEEVVEPNQGPPLHRHPNQVEIFHVVKGQFLFHLNGNEIIRGPGSVVLIPKGAIHAFKNIGEESGLLHFEMIPALNSEEGFYRMANEKIHDKASFFKEYGIEPLGPPL